MLEFCRQIFTNIQILNIKLHENFFRRKPSCSYGRREVTTLIVAFRNFANAPETNQLMLCGEIVSAGYENRSKHVNELYWQHVETFTLKASLLFPQRPDWY